MANTKIEDIKNLFKSRLNLAELHDGDKLSDLGLDSLDVVDMCLDLEERYGIHFEMEDLRAFVTVGDLFASIESKLQ